MFSDLRWNAMGPSGGHKFSELLQTNSNIVKLELQGNHLGKEFLQSIGEREFPISNC